MSVVIYSRKYQASSTLVFLYFVAVMLLMTIGGTAPKIFLYGELLLVSGAVLIMKNRINYSILAIACGALLLGIINMIAIGNMTPTRMVILGTSFFVAILILDERVSDKLFLSVLWINTLLVIVKMLLNGVQDNVYTEVSNNYISVFLISSLVLYCIKLDLAEKSPPIIPVIMVWIVSFLGGSRAGIISCTFFAISILVYSILSKKNDKFMRQKYLAIMFIISITGVYLIMQGHVSWDSSYRVIQSFKEQGMSSNARFVMWRDYVEALKTLKYMVFGVDIGTLESVTRYEGNLHNSFLQVHSYLGIIGIVGLIVLLTRSFWFSIKKGKWMIAISIVTFCLRALSDHVFGCYRLSPVLLALVLYPFVTERLLNRRNESC